MTTAPARAIACGAVLVAVLIVAIALLWSGENPSDESGTAARPGSGTELVNPPGGCPEPFRAEAQDARVTPGEIVLPLDLKSASYRRDTSRSPARIANAGTLTGRMPADRHVWLLSYARPDSVDLTDERNPGSGRLYPIGEIVTSDGCWTTPPREIGYAESVSIDRDQVLVLVGRNAHADFADEMNRKTRDGFSYDELAVYRAETIASFPIPGLR